MDHFKVQPSNFSYDRSRHCSDGGNNRLGEENYVLKEAKKIKSQRKEED
jgi:hypothetical protein